MCGLNSNRNNPLMKSWAYVWSLSALVASAGCTRKLPSTDGWVGQWTGVEGTFLRIEGGNGKYQITIRNLDGPRTFAGQSSGEVIAFEADGANRTIRTTDGAGTGMKWLAGKNNCLAVSGGDGYCRD